MCGYQILRAEFVEGEVRIISMSIRLGDEVTAAFALSTLESCVRNESYRAAKAFAVIQVFNRQSELYQKARHIETRVLVNRVTTAKSFA